jgi:hypothetical protein
MPSLKAECSSCRGTGLYSGFAEPEGTAVVCVTCQGQGWTSLAYTEFTGRKKRHGIRKVARSRGITLVGGVGPTSDAPMTYAEFERQFPVRES